MKKGISLIVLVITILVLAILAGAVIISLSNSNIIDEATKATHKADIASAKNAITLEYAAAVARGQAAGFTTGKAYNSTIAAGDTEAAANEKVMTAAEYYQAVTDAGITGVTQSEVLLNPGVDGVGAPRLATM